MSPGLRRWQGSGGAAFGRGVDAFDAGDLTHESPHRVLLGAGVLVSEHVTNLNALAGRRVEAVFAPLNIGGADGAPVRALARSL